MATLRELAERTGYSAATISRILSGDPALSVSMEARRKVLEEAGRLNISRETLVQWIEDYREEDINGDGTGA